jgi:hypothetical protein
MITLLLDQGLGEKGKTEKQAPLSRMNHYSYLRLLNIDVKK